MEDSDMWQKLVEVPAPSLAAKLGAIYIGGIQLSRRHLEEYIDGKDWSSDLVSDEDINDVLQLFVLTTEDPALFFVKEKIILTETYRQAQVTFQALCKDVTVIDNKMRGQIIEACLRHFDSINDELSISFQNEYDDLIVFITKDGRIATGRYEDK